MMDRRTFTFATLLGLGAAAPAAAGGLPQAVDAPPLRASWSLERKGSQLLATLTLHNEGAAPVDVAVSRGRLPGPWVRARVGEEELAPVHTELEMRDLMSRIGPMPKFEAVLAGRAKEVGTYVFQLSDPDTAEVALEAMVSTQDGVVEILQRVPIVARKSS